MAGRELVVTASIGAALDASGVSADQLLSNADLATFAAKELGGNRVTEFTEQMHAPIDSTI